MRPPFLPSTILFLLSVHLLQNHGTDALKPIDTVELQGIEGPVEHMAVDVKGQRIFLAATSKNAIVIVDSVKLRRLGTISGLAQPQDVIFDPASGNLLVSNAADGSLRTYDGTTLKLIDSKSMGGDADRIRLVPGGKSVLVGWGVGALAILDRQTGRRTDIHLRSHPESVQVDSSGNRIFVNLPGVGELVVIDRRSQTIVDSWALHHCLENGPMALDEANRRVFVVCRKPAKLLVLNMDDGALLATLSTVADADDVFYDSERKRIYVVGGEGSVAAYRQKSSDEYASLPRTETTPGARTGLFVPEWNRLYVAARNQPPFYAAEMLSFAVVD